MSSEVFHRIVAKMAELHPKRLIPDRYDDFQQPRRKRRALQQFIIELIESNERFFVDDFAKLEILFKLNLWLETYGRGVQRWGSREVFYRVAVEAQNESVCRALEFWLKRQPLIIEEVRIYCGREFVWNGKNVCCTSFNDRKQYITIIYPKTDQPHTRIKWSEFPDPQ
ncbi:MAG: hypothetical protein Athens101428_550 [Candidatus Berkelbacteria bacterium Athens1014_28]|uniref:Uncharacterized protein n=1 Tax=Candidatus Berkelbacteria bacterium Athens1014_28 TaxID=2017145 RepID=A0A554LLL2_9BACT|nr:MAG: hypothetical protein Athens101428_550 [Candidatus Berkelbacteria bacterium Athens1014_28]